MKILITGHCGFIGSHFAEIALYMGASVIGFNRFSDQCNMRRIARFSDHNEFHEVYGDLLHCSGICEKVDVVVNFAAKTFVDHAIRDPAPFITNNILGTHALMNDAAKHGVSRFIQISSDEVYGQILEGAYKEDAPLNPRNPYSWTKAAADLDGIWRYHTYGFPVIITRTENNFGPWQHPQKAIPTFVAAAMDDRSLPVYGDGGHVRCWLHVEEHCRAIWHLIKHGQIGEIYHIAGKEEMTNLDLAKLVLRTLNKPEDRIRFIPDAQARPGHDRRYALSCDKLEATGFKITQNVQEKLIETINWYAKNPLWH